MTDPNGRYYVEVIDKRYNVHATEKVILGLREEPKSLGTQYQFQHETQIRRNQKNVDYL